MTRHFSQIGFTEARTFTAQALSQGGHYVLKQQRIALEPSHRKPEVMLSMGFPYGL